MWMVPVTWAVIQATKATYVKRVGYNFERLGEGGGGGGFSTDPHPELFCPMSYEIKKEIEQTNPRVTRCVILGVLCVTLKEHLSLV